MGYFSSCDFVCLTPHNDTWRSHLICDVQRLTLAVTFPPGLVDIREMVLIVSCQIYLLSLDCDCALTSAVGGSVFGLMGLPPLYFWQGIILVIVWISILLEITLRLAGSDVFFLPQTCLTRFQNLISVSCCNHVFEDEWRKCSFIISSTNIFDRHFNRAPNIPSPRVKIRTSKPLITSHLKTFLRFHSNSALQQYEA